ncbi:RNA-binding suppressor of PAS kinase protein 1 [Pseudozyma hubeiensis]|nr:RNA-binding suppressor of PAS kinase protein 1 [Pseudozyma hubeiensis]
MTQPDALSSALAAATLHTSSDDPVSRKPAMPSFASALRSGSGQTKQSISVVLNDATRQSASTSPTPPPATHELAPIDDTILQAIRKRDDRIFFTQYENQMATFINDDARSTLELGPMNAYQRLLVHRCADQFQLEHHLHRATHTITLSKTSTTSHPSALLSKRARDYLVQRDGVDPASTHPSILSIAASSASETNTTTPSSSASTSSAASPALAPAAISSPASAAPKPPFKIMHRDPSAMRKSPLRSFDDDKVDSDKAKSRKDMTLEEREASYKAARARIFGDVASSDSTSSTSSTPNLDQSNHISHPVAPENKSSPSSSAASSPAASLAGARSSSRNKKLASSNSPSHRGKATATDLAEDDRLEFSRALPVSNQASLAHTGHQQSSPLASSSHVAPGYFAPAHSLHLQQSHSNPNLRSRAPVFYPQGSSTPTYSQGGALRHPAASGSDSFPALDSNARNRVAPIAGGAWNGSQNTAPTAGVAQEHHLNGVSAWAQSTSTFNNNTAPRHQQQQHYQAYMPYQHQHQHQHQLQPHQQLQHGANPYSVGQPPHYTQLGQQVHAYAPSSYAGSRNSSRASSQRGAHSNSRGAGARDDAVSVSSISSNSSSRSASVSGVIGAGANASGGDSSKPTGGTLAGLSHPSLPARPSWISPSNNGTSTASASASALATGAEGGEAAE